jgi:aspartate-semialdehyde dehydrogenase
MDPSKKLIVPEVNGQILSAFDKIIPNPNCSTIQLVMVLKPLHDRFKIKRVIVSTYQSISGTGVKAVRQMEAERSSINGEKAYPYPIDKNCIPQCDIFLDNDYTKEEMKLTNETKKIIDSSIEVSATAVRIPVVGGHSEAVNIEFENEYEIEEIKSLLSKMPGLTVQDEPSKLLYPMPIKAHGKNDVFVGRIRRDASQPKSLNLWIVADNLRKGAATNAVQIAKSMIGYINN